MGLVYLRALRPLRQGLRILSGSSRGVASRGVASRGVASRGVASRGVASRGVASEHDAHELGLAPAEHLVTLRVRVRLRLGAMVRLGGSGEAEREVGAVRVVAAGG